MKSKEYSYQSKHYQVLKRILDLIFCIPGVIILGIFCIILFFVNLFEKNEGPLFYKQERIGQYGKKFYMYKFRSMIVNAEQHLKDNPKLYQKYIKNSYKLEPDDDPRITKMGRFIRKTSIDELPQIINVLKGEMSFVGPRPIIEEEMNEYIKIGYEKEFQIMKPGITGLWQANGRSEIPYPERCDLELEYLNIHSNFEDIKIILKTIVNVIRQKGAH